MAIEKPDYSGDSISTVTIDASAEEFRGWTNTHTTVWDLTENNVFLGVPNVTQNTLPVMDPFIGGYGRVWCLQAPIFFATTLRSLLQRMMERYCRGLSGLSNYELQTTEITYGNTAESYTVPTSIKRGNNQFNLRFQEMQGGLWRNMMKYWITGISDLGSGYGTYHGKTFGESKLKYSAVNHTAIILYALTDNSGGAYGLDSLEFSCMWFGAYPTTVPNSHLEFTQGEHNTQELDLQFYGIYHETNTINEFAADMLLKSNFYKDNYNDFDIGPITWDAWSDRSGADGDSSENGNAGFEPMQSGSTQYTSLVTSAGYSSVKDVAENDG